MYRAWTLFFWLWTNLEKIGRNAASVFPLAVGELIIISASADNTDSFSDWLFSTSIIAVELDCGGSVIWIDFAVVEALVCLTGVEVLLFAWQLALFDWDDFLFGEFCFELLLELTFDLLDPEVKLLVE